MDAPPLPTGLGPAAARHAAVVAAARPRPVGGWGRAGRVRRRGRGTRAIYPSFQGQGARMSGGTKRRLAPVPNPVINQFGRSAGGGNNVPSAAELDGMYQQPAYVGPRPTDRYMTLDDVVQRTAAMLGTILLAGAIAWFALPDRLFTPVLIISAMGGL